jgi:hypothetical protein
MGLAKGRSLPDGPIQIVTPVVGTLQWKEMLPGSTTVAPACGPVVE